MLIALGGGVQLGPFSRDRFCDSFCPRLPLFYVKHCDGFDSRCQIDTPWPDTAFRPPCGTHFLRGKRDVKFSPLLANIALARRFSWSKWQGCRWRSGLQLRSDLIVDPNFPPIIESTTSATDTFVVLEQKLDRLVVWRLRVRYPIVSQDLASFIMNFFVCEFCTNSF
ncbi:hypothetical protein RRG08_024645 [Elysia crispata]|uniref:Uncharacterized protein n=1 Tax=Elysia crispata TaxID=231223 RepID=A0AAE0ZXN3_9GAST|nr:hypothetical protein RRG08_024645 [Elysia crispata]